MALINKKLQDYLGGLSASIDGDLGAIYQKACDEGLPVIPADVASFLMFLLASKRPKNILEIGCAIGFSAALFTKYLAPSGKVVTIDRYKYMIERAKENFNKLGVDGQITLLEEDAAIALPKLVNKGEKFDFIFMDCGKGQYLNFLPYCLELLETNGILAADDVLQNGMVSWDYEKIPKRQRTTYNNMRKFLETAKDLCTASILPIGDGLLVCVKDGEKDK